VDWERVSVVQVGIIVDRASMGVKLFMKKRKPDNFVE
jgi:hypothetical protein